MIFVRFYDAHVGYYYIWEDFARLSRFIEQIAKEIPAGILRCLGDFKVTYFCDIFIFVKFYRMHGLFN